MEAGVSSSIQKCMSMSPNEHLSAYKNSLLDFGMPLVALLMTLFFHHEWCTPHQLQVRVHVQHTPCCPRVHLHTHASQRLRLQLLPCCLLTLHVHHLCTRQVTGNTFSYD
ncbi:hypothetical protein PAHAL_5G268500 [Panicum hallii]|uniref:Uncharacterized protein n=1 Tax=Panicum hallii TaxID=206008 RepID=A0A2S3HUG3_9POAL|nr:hypothetical protein PAHAL_5G268500 [Panicum hallii]